MREDILFLVLVKMRNLTQKERGKTVALRDVPIGQMKKLRPKQEKSPDPITNQ